MIYVRMGRRFTLRGAGVLLRQLLFRLGRALIRLSNVNAPPAGLSTAYHLDAENLATGFSAPVRRQLEKAAEDFESAARGLEPVHARKELGLLDGGTTIWQGDGYTIRLMKSLTSVGDVNGYMFGPVLKLDYPLAMGNTTEVSQVTFYTPAALDRFLGQA